MARNLGRKDCYFCGGEVILVENWRTLSEAEARGYYEEYKYMTVAEAHCAACCAKYLAWHGVYWEEQGGGARIKVSEIRDLSFRSTFDDEPGLADLPKYEIEIKRVRVGPFDPSKRYKHLLKADAS